MSYALVSIRPTSKCKPTLFHRPNYQWPPWKDNLVTENLEKGSFLPPLQAIPGYLLAPWSVSVCRHSLVCTQSLLSVSNCLVKTSLPSFYKQLLMPLSKFDQFVQDDKIAKIFVFSYLKKKLENPVQFCPTAKFDFFKFSPPNFAPFRTKKWPIFVRALFLVPSINNGAPSLVGWRRYFCTLFLVTFCVWKSLFNSNFVRFFADFCLYRESLPSSLKTVNLWA